MNGQLSSQFPVHAKCDVCDSQVFYPGNSWFKEQGYTVCHASDCKRIIRQKSSLAPFAFEMQLKFKKELISQRKKAAAAKQKHEEKVMEEESRQDQEILQSALRENPELSSENIHVLGIPAGPTKLQPLSEDRIRAYTEHLREMIRQAARYDCADDLPHDKNHLAHLKGKITDQKLDEVPGLRTMSEKLCTMCGGGCCPSGGDHAYVTVESMRRLMDRLPGLTHAEILDLFLSSMSPETLSGGCINQTEVGCTLNRDLRSATCNMYFCDPLRDYQQRITAKKDIGTVLAVQRSNTNWNRFETETSNRIVRIALINK